MTYGQVILILFVVLIGYYGFLIFMDIQHLKAAEAAAQENQSEEEIDITDEARSFQPQQETRDDKKKEEEKKLEEAGNENASSKSGEDVPVSEETSSTENPSSETASQTQTAEPDNADATSTSDATDEDEIEDATHADTETVPSEAETSAGSNFSPTYREPILTDGILVDDIFKAIDQLAETGECDLGTIIYHCESMRYAG